MEIWMGGQSLNLETLKGGGGRGEGTHAVSEFRWKGGQKNVLSVMWCGFFGNNPTQMYMYLR